VHRSGSNVYLVGVRHDQKQSQQDVRDVIRTVKPQVVMVELDEIAYKSLKRNNFQGCLEQWTAIEEAKLAGARLVLGDKSRQQLMEGLAKAMSMRTLVGLFGFAIEIGSVFATHRISQVAGSDIVQRTKAQQVLAGELPLFVNTIHTLC
jgi:pheromone shutdown protein TraB